MKQTNCLYNKWMSVLGKGDPVTVFLTNGVKLSGFVVEYDDDCLTLKRDASEQLVMRQAVATIMPVSELPEKTQKPQRFEYPAFDTGRR